MTSSDPIDGTRFVLSARMPCTRHELAAWHGRRGALERLVPGWSGVRVVRSLEEMTEGAIAELSVPLGPAGLVGIRSRWKAIHEELVAGEQFVDRALSGPFAGWRHVHRFHDAPGDVRAESMLEDDVTFRLPFGPLGRLGRSMVLRDLARTFAWRHHRTRNDLRRHRSLPGPPLTVAISGATGLVGSALTAFLSTGGHTVRRIVRRQSQGGRPDDIVWDLRAGTIDAAALEGVDAVVHLAGESIAARWTEAKRVAIRESRVRGTDLLARTIAGLRRPPSVFVSASAIGFYGHRGDEAVDESAARGAGFLAEVCEAWENAAAPARAAGVRVVHPRIGMVLSGAGGALTALLTPFSVGLGGPVGSGRQAMSWIALDDLLGVLLAAIRMPALAGPVNAVAPGAVSNRTFGTTLGAVLRRPAVLPLPVFAVRTLFGAMGEELLLGGAFVRPAALGRAAFAFDFPDLDSALRFELGRLTHA